MVLPPFADLLAPLWGIAAMVSASPKVARRFGQINMVSLVNGAIGLAMGMVEYDALGPFGVMWPVLLISIKLLVRSLALATGRGREATLTVCTAGSDWQLLHGALGVRTRLHSLAPRLPQEQVRRCRCESGRCVAARVDTR
jgi:hypothetical protein